MIETEQFRKSLEHKNDAELNYLQHRINGASTRILDGLVQEFFNKPMGEKIYVQDHYGTRQADRFLMDRLARRIEDEHHCKFKIGSDRGFYIIRTEPTYHELILQEIERRKEKQ